MHLYYPKEDNGKPYISFDANKRKVNDTIKGFREIVKKIENKNFDMSHVIKSQKQCGNCDMRFYCNPGCY